MAMNRFSCRRGRTSLALGKNSMYRWPQWWQTMAKQAALRSLPSSASTFTKPQSIWNASPGSVL